MNESNKLNENFFLLFIHDKYSYFGHLFASFGWIIGFRFDCLLSAEVNLLLLIADAIQRRQRYFGRIQNARLEIRHRDQYVGILK